MKKMILGLIAGLIIGSVGTAAANSPTVQAVFQKFVLQVEGQTHNIEPLVYQGTTYLPVRDVSGLLGYDVKYDGKTRTIQLNEKGADSVNNVATEEWISLKDLAEKYELNIGQTPDSNGMFRVWDDNAVYFEFDPVNDTDITDRNGNKIRKKTNDGGHTLFNISDLIKAGVIN